MDTLTFVGMTGSLRRASRNKGLLRCCAAHLPEGVRMEIADISALPFYNEDLEKPQAVKDLALRVVADNGQDGVAAAILNCLDPKLSPSL